MHTTPTAVLTLEERDVLAHVVRYRLGLPEAIARVPRLRRRGTRGTRRLLRALAQRGLLAFAPLYDGRRYVHLTDAGMGLLPIGEHEEGRTVCGPLSEEAKVRNFAALAFCCLQSSPRERLTAAEFRTHFPDLYRPGLPMNYYVDSAGESPRLGLLRIDLGGRGRWDRVVAKCREDLRDHERHAGFARLIRDAAFEVTLVTALPQKAERIARAFDSQRPSIPLRVCALPELLYLVAPPPSLRPR